MPSHALAALLWLLPAAQVFAYPTVGGRSRGEEPPAAAAPAGAGPAAGIDEVRTVIQRLDPSAPTATPQASGGAIPATIVLTDGEPEAAGPDAVTYRILERAPVDTNGAVDEINRLTRSLRFDRHLQPLWDWRGNYSSADDEFAGGFGRYRGGDQAQLPFAAPLHQQQHPDRPVLSDELEAPPAPDIWTLPLDGAAAPAPGRKAAGVIAARARDERRRLSAYWDVPQGVLIKAAGQEYPLTFSLDSELDYADALRAILKHEPSLERLRAYTDRSGLILADQLAREVGMSAKQFDSFALRPGVERGKADYSLTDLSPSYFAIAVKKHTGDFDRTDNLRALVGAAAQALDLPMLASLDSLQKTVPLRPEDGSNDVELAHSSWEEVRSMFAAVIRRLHEVLTAPQTHLHLGIPSAIGKDATIAVARAVETLMILDLASAPPGNLQEQRFRATTLERAVYDRMNDYQRGLVNLVFDEWKEPHLTNNLELRYHPDIETGLRWLALAGELTRRHKRLLVFPDFDGGARITDTWIRRETDDALTVNLTGALKYASLILARSGDPGERLVADDLARFSQRVAERERARDFAFMDLREELADYLRSRRVPQLMTADRFLIAAR